MLSLQCIFWLSLGSVDFSISRQVEVPERVHIDDNDLRDYMARWLLDMFPSNHLNGDLVLLPQSSGNKCSIAHSNLESWIYVHGKSCTQYPKELAVNSSKLLIKATKIKSIRRGDFYKISQLEGLVIESNEDLRFIEGGVFGNLVSLKNLSISNNYKLKPLHADVFLGLLNLVDLKLVKANIQSVSSIANSLTHLLLPKLLYLDLSYNNLHVINSNDLLPLSESTLSSIKLDMCDLSFIAPDAFEPVRWLNTLKLGYNNLNTSVLTSLLSNIVNSNTDLRYLELVSVKLDKQPTKLFGIIGQSNITHLSIQKNILGPLVPGYFPMMPKLEFLDMNDVTATDIEENTINATLMPHLKRLFLAGNKIPGINSGVLIPSLIELDLSKNFDDRYFSPPSLFQLGMNYFINMSRLKILNLSYNVLHRLQNNSFTGLLNLKALILSNCTIYVIEALAFETLSELEVLDLSHNLFPIYFPLNYKMFRGLKNLTMLNLEACGLTSITANANVFKEMGSLKFLVLRSNSIFILKPDTFSPINSLTMLDISNNNLNTWSFRLFENNSDMEVLYLSGNKIDGLSVAMLQDFTNLKHLDLQGNPLNCDCLLMQPVIALIHSKNKNAVDYHLADSLNMCYMPEELIHTHISTFLDTSGNGSTCSSNETRTSLLVFAIPAIVIITVAGVVAFLIFRFKWHIRYWAFLSREVIYRGSKTSNNCTSYKYDAFVSYSNEDRNFVVRLVSMLENYEPYFNLCVCERDSNIDDVISETVLIRVAASRRIILVISNAFAISQWCTWETQIAQNHRQLLGGCETDVLILLKIGEVISKNTTPTLRYLLKTRVYLEWDADHNKQKQFWNKLRNALLSRKSIDSTELKNIQ